MDKAIEIGYKVVTIDEVWHYEESEVGLFAPYINKFFKMKTEAFGWPTGVETEGQKNAFLKDFEVREGVMLNLSAMIKNSGLRASSKLCLNRYRNGNISLDDASSYEI